MQRGHGLIAPSALFNDDDDDNNRSKATLDMDLPDLAHEVYLCMVWHGGFLGLAFYDLASLQIQFMLDIQENDNFAIVRQAVHQIHPSVIVLNTIQDSRIVSFLRSIVSEINVGNSGSSHDVCRLEFLPNVDFNFQVCKRRILALSVPSVSKHLSQDEKYLYFSSLLPFGSSNMMSSVGGLLKYLEKTRVGIELDADVAQVPVLGFKAFIPEHHIQMDGLTFCALKIFETEIHPSTYKAGHNSGGKEGLSLYEWFLRPLKNAVSVKQRHEAVDFFMSAHNMEVVKCLSGCLKHIKYIPKILLRMSRAQATVGDWSALYRTLYHAVYIGNIAKSQPTCIEIFRKIANSFTEDLHSCVNLICKTIDFEASKMEKKFIVLPHVDPVLDEKKRTFNGLPDLLNQVASKEIENLSADIKVCSVSYLPEIGYLLVIEMAEGKTPEDDHSVEGMKFMFHSNNELYYKSPKTIELDSILGDTQLEIVDMELKIMHGLQSVVLECTSVMLSIMELAAELDCLMALATCASEFGYVKPVLVQDNVIHIKGGRHPLQELCSDIFVPNDVMLGGSSSKIKLITGPNSCGKSVYLKQVALIVFMAHVGSFVPAEEAVIGPCDAIYSRLKSVESTAVHMSTFMQDLSQVSQALSSASAKSLVIMDEFGKGTESTDGLSLLTAVIKYWMGKQHDCPFVLIATHFHSIIQQRLLPSTSRIEYLTFDTLANEEELVFLYQLIPGHTSSSYACKCATQVGIPGHVVTRGQQVSDLLCQFKTVPVEDSSTCQARKRMHEQIVDKFLDLNLNEDGLDKFLKEFVLKLSNDIAGASKNGKPVNENGPGKSDESPSKKSSTNVSNPSTSRDQSTELSHEDRTKSNQKKQNIEVGRPALKKNDNVCGAIGIVNAETKKLFRDDSNSISGEKNNPAFDTPVFPTALAPGNGRNQLQSNEMRIGANERHHSVHNHKDTGRMDNQKSNKEISDTSSSSTKAERIHPYNSTSGHAHKGSNKRSKAERLPLFTTPCDPKFYNEDDYSKSFSSRSTFVAGSKRKMENVDTTATQIKHEKLFNPRTPSFPCPDRSSAFSTKSSRPSTSAGDDSESTIDDHEDNNGLEGMLTNSSYSRRISDFSGNGMRSASSIAFSPREEGITSTDMDDMDAKKTSANQMFTPSNAPHSGSSSTNHWRGKKVTTIDSEDPRSNGSFRQTSSTSKGLPRKTEKFSVYSVLNDDPDLSTRKMGKLSTDLSSSSDSTPQADPQSNGSFGQTSSTSNGVPRKREKFSSFSVLKDDPDLSTRKAGKLRGESTDLPCSSDSTPQADPRSNESFGQTSSTSNGVPHKTEKFSIFSAFNDDPDLSTGKAGKLRGESTDLPCSSDSTPQATSGVANTKAFQFRNGGNFPDYESSS